MGGLYYLSHLDGNMLWGDGSGVFVFIGAQPRVMGTGSIASIRMNL